MSARFNAIKNFDPLIRAVRIQSRSMTQMPPRVPQS